MVQYGLSRQEQGPRAKAPGQLLSSVQLRHGASFTSWHGHLPSSYPSLGEAGLPEVRRDARESERDLRRRTNQSLRPWSRPAEKDLP